MKLRLTSLALILFSVGTYADSFINEAVSNTKIQVNSGRCELLDATVVNRDTSNAIFVHCYDALSANVTVGTTTQTTFFAIPAGGAWILPRNRTFTTGLTIAITTSPLSSGTTAPGTAAVVNLIYSPL